MMLSRKIHDKPRRNAFNCLDLRCSYESVEQAIQYALNHINLKYFYPPAISTFFVEDENFNAELYISQPNQQSNKFYVEIVRYGGDGFITHDLVYHIIDYYNSHEMNESLDEKYKIYIKDVLELYKPDEDTFPDVNDEHATYSI